MHQKFEIREAENILRKFSLIVKTFFQDQYCWQEKILKTWLIPNRIYTHNLSSCKINAGKKIRPKFNNCLLKLCVRPIMYHVFTYKHLSPQFKYSLVIIISIKREFYYIFAQLKLKYKWIIVRSFTFLRWIQPDWVSW